MGLKRVGPAGVAAEVSPCGAPARGASVSARSRRPPALPCGGAGSPALTFALRPPQPLFLLVASLPCVFPFPFLFSTPVPYLGGNPRVSISAVTLPPRRGRAVPVKLCSQFGSLCSWFLWMPFGGAGLFLAAAPVGSGGTEELGRLQCVTRCVTLAAAFCSCHVLGKVALSAPLELHAASRGRRVAQRLSLGVVPRRGRPAWRRNPLEAT